MIVDVFKDAFHLNYNSFVNQIPVWNRRKTERKEMDYMPNIQQKPSFQTHKIWCQTKENTTNKRTISALQHKLLQTGGGDQHKQV